MGDLRIRFFFYSLWQILEYLGLIEFGLYSVPDPKLLSHFKAHVQIRFLQKFEE
jgi:hypothetical protein